MKKNILMSLFLVMFMLVPVFLPELFADAPPDPGGDPTGGTPVGGGSPIGGGLIMLLGMGVIYGFRKFNNSIKK